MDYSLQYQHTLIKMVYHCQQCNQPIMTVHHCPVEGCTTRYCSSACRHKDLRENGHARFVCKKVHPFEDTTNYIMSPQANTGLAASRFIKRGQTIMVETSAAREQGNFKTLPKSILSRLQELEPRPSGPIVDNDTYLSKFQYNSYNERIFLNFAYMNHSCKPVADFYFVSEYNVILVIALFDIDVGQEITVNYLSEYKKDRRQALLDQWGFYCQCHGCTDKKTGIVIDLIATITHQLAATTDPDKVLELCDKQLAMYDLIQASPIMYYEMYTTKSHCAASRQDRNYFAYLANRYMHSFLKSVIV